MTTKINYNQIKAAPFNAVDYGVVADGSYNLNSFVGSGTGTNNAVTLQAAIDAVDAAGGGILLLPPGTMRCDTGLTLNVGRVKMVGQYSWLDFKNLANAGVAITVVGNSDTDPFGNSPGGIDGVNMTGPGDVAPVTGAAIAFVSASADACAWSSFRNMAILWFWNGFTVGTNSYGITIDNCNVRVGGTCLQDETAATNTGERIVVCNSAFTGAQYGVIAQNGASDFFFSGTSLDTSVCAVRVKGSTVALHGCHIECVGYAYQTDTLGGSNARLVSSGCRIIQRTNSGAAPFLSIGDATFFELIGGDVSFAETGTVTAISISASSRFVMLGTFRNYPYGEVDSILGSSLMVSGQSDSGFTGLTAQSGKETFSSIATGTATPITTNLSANPGLYHVYGYITGGSTDAFQGQCTVVVNDNGKMSILQNASGASWTFSIVATYLNFAQASGGPQDCVVTWLRVA